MKKTITTLLLSFLFVGTLLAGGFTDKISKGSGTVNILRNISAEEYAKYLCVNNGFSFFGVDVNEEGSGNENRDSVGVAIKSATLTINTDHGIYIFDDYATSTTAMIKEVGATIAKRYYTLLGGIGSDEIAGNGRTVGDDVFWFNNVNFKGNILSATLNIVFVDTGKKPQTPNEQFYDFSNGYEEIYLLDKDQAIDVENAQRGIKKAPKTVEITKEKDLGQIIAENPCPKTWCAWQEKWNLDAFPDEFSGVSLYPNLINYAFCKSPYNGKGFVFCLKASETDKDNKIDAVFSAPNGGASDVIYQLQYMVGQPPNHTWQTSDVSPILDSEKFTDSITGKTIYRLKDLGAIIGNVDRGVVRLVVTLDENGNNQVDTWETTIPTDEVGWIRTFILNGIRTLNDPFLSCPVFTGRVGATDQQSVYFFNQNIQLSELIKPDLEYYMEVVDGPYEGHRFDIEWATTNSFVAFHDSNLYGVEHPHSTWIGTLPNLTGASIVVRQHRTLKNLLPPSDFPLGSTVDANFGNIWVKFDLQQNLHGKFWSDVASQNMNDLVIPAGQGVYIGSNETKYLMLYGSIRKNDFIKPLPKGLTQVGSGYPYDASANTRAMTIDANGFFGNADWKAADQFLLWRGDKIQSNNSNYDTYFLLHSTGRRLLGPYWALTGDVSIRNQSDVLHFAPDYSILLKRLNENTTNKMPKP